MTLNADIGGELTFGGLDIDEASLDFVEAVPLTLDDEDADATAATLQNHIVSGSRS